MPIFRSPASFRRYQLGLHRPPQVHEAGYHDMSFSVQGAFVSSVSGENIQSVDSATLTLYEFETGQIINGWNGKDINGANGWTKTPNSGGPGWKFEGRLGPDDNALVTDVPYGWPEYHVILRTIVFTQQGKQHVRHYEDWVEILNVRRFPAEAEE